MRERGALSPWEGVLCLCLTLNVRTSHPLVFPRFSCCSGITCSEFEILFRKAQEKMLRVSDSGRRVRGSNTVLLAVATHSDSPWF